MTNYDADDQITPKQAIELLNQKGTIAIALVGSQSQQATIKVPKAFALSWLKGEAEDLASVWAGFTYDGRAVVQINS